MPQTLSLPRGRRLPALAALLLTAASTAGLAAACGCRKAAPVPESSKSGWPRSLTLPEDHVLTTIAFGACARQQDPQPIWDAVIGVHPDVFLFIGDNIYADTQDLAELRAKYDLLAGQPGYRRLCERCAVVAVWDDHDYGRNDAGAEFPAQRGSQQVFCDFFGEAPDSPRRTRRGIYDGRVYGVPGRRVQIILLDTRFNRTPLRSGPDRGLNPDGYPGRYQPETSVEATILGGEQWAWLEEQLRRPAEVRIIASSIQVVSEDHGFEKWMNFPAERQRLCELIRSTGAAGVILISGDRHKGELSRLEGCAAYPLFDLTSSGLNQVAPWYNEINRHRVGTEYRQENFGLIRVDWAATAPVISLEVHKLDGSLAIRQDVPLSELQPPG